MTLVIEDGSLVEASLIRRNKPNDKLPVPSHLTANSVYSSMMFIVLFTYTRPHQQHGQRPCGCTGRALSAPDPSPSTLDLYGPTLVPAPDPGASAISLLDPFNPPLRTSLANSAVVPVQATNDAAATTAEACAAAQMAPRQNSRRATKAAIAVKPAK